MSSPQASGAASPSSGGQLEDAVTTFSDAVFEATEGLLKAQQELTHHAIVKYTEDMKKKIEADPAKYIKLETEKKNED